jgi:hypothetical protein
MLIPEMISYLTHKKGIDFLTLSEDEFVQELVGLAKPIFDYFRDADDDDIREKYSRKFGEGGVKEYLYNLCELIIGEHAEFGLKRPGFSGGGFI